MTVSRSNALAATVPAATPAHAARAGLPPTAAKPPSLEQLPIGTPADVLAVRAPDGRNEWAQQLEDLGFVAGERVTVLARARPGGDPMVVRVGLSTYALRRAEAACIDIRVAPSPHA